MVSHIISMEFLNCDDLKGTFFIQKSLPKKYFPRTLPLRVSSPENKEIIFSINLLYLLSQTPKHLIMSNDGVATFLRNSSFGFK